MHYGDPKHLESNILKLVIYTHGGSSEGIYFEVTSIVECRWFHPGLLCHILQNAEEIFPTIDKLKNLPLEKYWILTLKEIRSGQFDILEIEGVSDHLSDFYFIH